MKNNITNQFKDDFEEMVDGSASKLLGYPYRCKKCGVLLFQISPKLDIRSNHHTYDCPFSKVSINDAIFQEYARYLKETFDISHDDVLHNINVMQETMYIRDEFLGRMGETELVKLMKANKTFKKNKKSWEKYLILTLDEYINNK